jgi:hypothetical protein
MGDMQFNGTPDEWEALVKKNKMSNNNESSVEWFANESCQLKVQLDNQEISLDEYAVAYVRLLYKAKEMEATSKQMSYGDGYSNGYDRALELVKWKINNELAINNK